MRRVCLSTVLVTLSFVSLEVSGAVEATARRTETERLERLVEEIQPAVAELTGMPEGKQVKVIVMSRSEFKEFLVDLVAMEYPDDELIRRGRCLAEIGLVPEDYDLEAGFLDLVGQEGGGLYDPRAKAFVGISDLPPVLMTPFYQDMIVSHELTHALQDRQVDIVAESEVGLKNLDYEYAFRSTIEGMATVVMIAYMQDKELDRLPDTRVFMRSGFEQRDLREFPHYLREVLISPYAEGGAFVQRWLKVNPHKQMVSLFYDIPATSEQILHPDKYLDRDEPTPIDVSGLAAAVPESWDPYYTNTLGEFDLLTLFRMYPATNPDAAEAAAGWDGLRFAAYVTPDDELVIVGSSAWDSEHDAEEFESALSEVLTGLDDPEFYHASQSGASIYFIIGPAGTATRESIFEALGPAR
ncbi:MAG: hypothetical protein ABIJ00_10685 [Candidatus Eisenbacteria bacterium]